jgi:hypothetical protein
MLDVAEEAISQELSRLESELEAAVQKVVSLTCYLCHLLIFLSRLMIRVKVFSRHWLNFDGTPIQHLCGDMVNGRKEI